MYNSYGGFWRRSLAFLIDQLILNIIYIVLLLSGGLSHALGQAVCGNILTSGGAPGAGAFFMPLYAAVVIIVTLCYFTYFVGVAGKTPGKMILGLEIVNASKGEMTFAIAFLRWVGYLVSGFPLFLGFIWIAFDSRKQGWHDKLAGTVVVRGGG